MKAIRMQWPRVLFFSAIIVFSQPLYAEDAGPYLLVAADSSANVSITISNLTSGSTYYLEQLGNLSSNDWNEVYHFEGAPGETNWTTATSNSGFFRAIQDSYHAKVGQIALLDVPGFHDVSGTAHIVNNRTIELRNFNFDGGGIVVEVWLSSTGSFKTDYISISDDLFGTAFTNATLSLTIPEGTDLDDVNYISIWCVAANASFGDGPFLHPKVGQSASLDMPGHHLVSGTAHIVDNRTIELRNFNYDGDGIVVEVWLSDTGNFATDYISISEDLFGTAYTNATLSLTIPEGTDLDEANYISIWCVEAGVSFGDGPFQ